MEVKFQGATWIWCIHSQVLTVLSGGGTILGKRMTPKILIEVGMDEDSIHPIS